jgi:uncharacterized membrane protein YbhN (UPF0104 family)
MTRKLLTAGFYLAVFVFLLIFAMTLDFETLISFEVNWFPLAFGTALAVSARFLFAVIWKKLLQSMGAELTPKKSRELFGVYGKSWLGRYLPGSATWVVGKIYFASNLGISKTKLAVSSIMEGLLQLVVVLALAAALLVFDPRVAELAQGYESLLLLVTVMGLVCVYPRVFNGVISWIYRSLKKAKIDDANLLSNKAVIEAGGLFAVTSILNSVSLLMVALAFDYSLIDNSFLILGIASLASAVSLLVVIAPAGIGVREGVQILGLSLIASPELALAITLMMRFMSILWDLVFYFVTRLVSK